MSKLTLTLRAFASMVMPVIGGEPIGPVLANPTTSDQDALILRILKAVETHDYRTLLIYTLDKETDYFGHKNSSSAFRIRPWQNHSLTEAALCCCRLHGVQGDHRAGSWETELELGTRGGGDYADTA